MCVCVCYDAVLLTCRTSLEELRRQHELDIEQVKQRHREELEDLRSVYSHTRYVLHMYMYRYVCNVINYGTVHCTCCNGST